MIELRLTAAEALYALSAIQAAGAKAHHSLRMLIDTGAPLDETSIPETSAAIYDRLERSLRDQLYPDPRWENRLEEARLGIA